ncbi:MAG: hypothetical protein AAGA93_15380 [Actinomycetota bacterium]
MTKVDHADDDIVTGDGIPGANGGSGPSSLGGTIRLGDLERGRIGHAIKLTIDASQWLSRSNGGLTPPGRTLAAPPGATIIARWQPEPSPASP